MIDKDSERRGEAVDSREWVVRIGSGAGEMRIC